MAIQELQAKPRQAIEPSELIKLEHSPEQDAVQLHQKEGSGEH